LGTYARPCLFVQLISIELSREPVALHMCHKPPIGVHNADATGPALCLGLFFQSLKLFCCQRCGFRHRGQPVTGGCNQLGGNGLEWQTLIFSWPARKPQRFLELLLQRADGCEWHIAQFIDDQQLGRAVILRSLPRSSTFFGHRRSAEEANASLMNLLYFFFCLIVYGNRR
jgi:hypothetical protein